MGIENRQVAGGLSQMQEVGLERKDATIQIVRTKGFGSEINRISGRDNGENMKSVDWEVLIFREIADKKMKRKDVAQTYRYLIQERDTSTDWSKINHAIIDRWSMSALLWIKDQAWSGKCLDDIRPHLEAA